MTTSKPTSDSPAPRTHLWRLDSALLIKAVAGGLIHAVLYWPSAAFDLVLPLQPGLDLQVRPGLVAPLFVGFTHGPVAGAITGVVGHLVGELLAGRPGGAGALAIGMLQSGLLGLVAGLGSVRRFRALRDVGAVALWTLLAALGAQGLPVLVVLVLAQFRPGTTVEINIVLSGLLTTLVNAALLLPAVLVLWDRSRPRR